MISVSAYSGETYVLDPLSPWNKESANIDSAFITVTPYVTYAQVDIILNYSAKGSSFSAQNNDLALEVVTDFDIPEKTIVVDSWLWIEDYVSKGYLIDLYTATNVYESYVVRAQDPSLLRYTQGNVNKLSLNIYPLPAASYRKVKLTFLVPIIDESTAFSVNPIVDLFINENINENSYCSIKVFNNDTYVSGSLRTSLGNYSTIDNGTNYVSYNMNLNEINESFAITYNKNTNNKQFAYNMNNGFGYYNFEHYFLFDFNQCTFGNVTKVMNDSSITYNEFSSLEIYPNGIKINESGNYFNDAPDDFIIEYICNNTVIKDSLNTVGKLSPLAEKIWANDKIFELTLNKSNTYSYYYGSSYEPNYAEIIQTSMDYRVLSYYTAFLALPQEDTVEASLENNSDTWTININELNSNDISFNCFPNPFKDKLNIEIEFLEHIDINNLKSKVIDLSGRVVYQFKSVEIQDNKKISLFWNGKNSKGEQVNSGVYFIVVELHGKTYTYEIMKN